ncbi:hypothetical protein ACIRYZ_27640 [Kitasatospora sp. NPDC101155]|uniref:hypothetical protein n=1 Tax=Kitasatospora sp. NPDC101155 TaxID=3364097 RepID=UPI0038096F97
MRNNDPGAGQGKSDDEQWDDFVKSVAMEEEAHRRASEPPPKRVWPRNAALAVGAAALTVLGIEVTQPSGDTTAPAAQTSAPVTAAPAAAESTGAAPTGRTASNAPAAAGRPQIPLDQVFPAEVKAADGTVYTKVGSATLASCTEPDSVGPRLIALIKASKGCLGEQIALYKDPQNNQFNLALFTMEDPVDTVHLVTQLSMEFEDFEVGAQAPPPASGLPVLPADSGMVQAFSGAGRAMLATLGQWSDGRGTDRQQLVDRLTPLQTAVGKTVFAYESQR